METYEFEYTNWLSKKRGSAQLDEASVTFVLDGQERRVQFGDLASYKVEEYNGVVLYLRFAGGEKFKISANSNFCNPEPFRIFCDDLDKKLTRAVRDGNIALTRKPGTFEQKAFYIVLLAMTIILVLAIVYSLSVGAGLSSYVMPIAVFIGLWISYFGAQKKRQRRTSDL